MVAFANSLGPSALRGCDELHTSITSTGSQYAMTRLVPEARGLSIPIRDALHETRHVESGRRPRMLPTQP